MVGTTFTGYRVNVFIAIICVILSLSLTASSQEPVPGLTRDDSVSISSFSFSFASSSDKLPIEDKRPCVFRGQLYYHKDEFTIDSCTLCICNNGTTDCHIITCQTPKCPNPVKITGECCPQCPYTMQLFELFNKYPPLSKITEGKIVKMRINAEIEVQKGKTSRKIRGENLWRIGAWVSRNSDGSGPKFSYNSNILSEKQRAQEFLKKDYNPPEARWAFHKMRYNFDAREGTCADFKYLCLKFNMTDDPRPTFDLDFTYSVFREEYDREIDCVRLGRCRGVFAETFDWELTGENPIPGEETPVSIDIDVTFRQDTRDLEGDDLWRVALFGSSNILGEGPRFGEVAQILNDDESSTDIRNANPLEIDGIQTDFEYGTIGCIEDVNYICMEFLKGDAPNPEFTLLVDGGRGDVARETMVLCKPQECQSRVVFTELEATLLNPEIIVENTDTDTTVKLKATTDKLLTTTVSGEQLWQVKTFFSQNDDGRGRRVNEQPQILTATQDDQTLNTGENLAFSEMDFQVDLSGLTCAEIPYMCFELMKNPLSSIDYTFETQPEQDPFVDCISMDDVCKGVVFTELEWSREVPEDHVPGTESSVVIDASVDVEPYSREVTGVDLWQVSVFASRDELGNQRRDPIFADILTPIEAATTLPQGGPLTFPSLETPPFDVDKMGCGEFRYLCVEFRKGDNPVPDFTYETKSGEDTIVKCHAEDCAASSRTAGSETEDRNRNYNGAHGKTCFY